MKKLLAVSLLACLATAAFGIDLGAGIGATVGGFWATSYYEDYYVIYDVYRDRYATVPFGISAWFDATYGMAAVGFRANGNTHNTLTTDGVLGPDTSEADDGERSGFLSLSLLGRYPFALGPVSLFPLLGVEYDLILYRQDADGSALSTDGLGQFWFKAGGGADIVLFKGLFMRPLVLFGLKVLTADEKVDVQAAKDDGGANVARRTDFLFEGGLQVGWRF